MTASPGAPAPKHRREHLFTGASVASRSFEVLVAAAALMLAARVTGHVPFRQTPLTEWPTFVVVVPVGIAAVTLYSLTTLSMGHQKTCFNMGSGAAFAVILTLPPSAALPVAFTGMLAAQCVRRYRGRQRLTLPTIAFNQAQYVATWSLASAMYWRLLLDLPRSAPLVSWVPAAGAALVYMLVNTWLVAAWTALRRRAWAWDAWLCMLREMLPGYAISLGVGAVVAGLATHDPVLGVAALGLALAAYRAALGLTHGQRREIAITLGAIVEAAERRSLEFTGHSERVAWWAERVARHLGAAEEAADTIAIAAKLHDLGKAAMGIPIGEEGGDDNGLAAAVRLHPTVASDIVMRCRGFDGVARYLRSQAEWYDGSGYPDGRRGGAIPLASRIIAVADLYDTTRCRYRDTQGAGAEQALEEVRRHIGTRFDPAVVSALEAIVSADAMVRVYAGAFSGKPGSVMMTAFAGAPGEVVTAQALPGLTHSSDDWEHDAFRTPNFPWDSLSSRDRRRSRSLLDAQEAERRSLARELHDEIGGTLTLLSQTLRAAPACAARCVVHDAQVAVQKLTERVRSLSHNLRPPMLDDFGLAPALTEYAARYAKQTGIHARLIHAGIDRRFDRVIETAAYRIVQEALTNAARHAQPSEVTIFADVVHGVLAITVCDNGTGFDLDAIRASGRASGIVGMRERATIVGGSLKITSRPGAGTTIEASLPIWRPRGWTRAS